jgi:hypothetical protein
MAVSKGKRSARNKGNDAHDASAQKGAKRDERTEKRAEEIAIVADAPNAADAPKAAKIADAPKAAKIADAPKADAAKNADAVVDEFYAPTSWDWLYGGGAPARQDALFVLDVSGTIGEEYRPLFFDIARMVCIHTTIQLMAFVGGTVPGIFTSEFAEMLLYIIVGTMLFWLVLRKLIWLA